MSSLGLITLYLPTVMELTFNSSAMHFVWLDCSSNRIDSVVHDNNPYVITRINSFFWVSIWIIANNICVFCCLFVFFSFFKGCLVSDTMFMLSLDNFCVRESWKCRIEKEKLEGGVLGLWHVVRCGWRGHVKSFKVVWEMGDWVFYLWYNHLWFICSISAMNYR